MEYLVDGYNVLHADPDAFGSLTRTGMPAARARLAGTVDRFCARTRARAVIVFDGAGDPPEGGLADVRVLFSGGRSADDVLKEIVDRRAGPSGRSLRLVSSDRDLIRHAKSAGLPTLGSEPFLKELRRKGTPPGGRTGQGRNRTLTSAEVDAWLSEFGLK